MIEDDDDVRVARLQGELDVATMLGRAPGTLFAVGGSGPPTRADPELRDALRAIDQAVARLAHAARMAA
jgi:hypothetical protein